MTELCPINYEKKERNFHFHALTFQGSTYKVEIFYQKIQVQFEFGVGPMIFNRVMPLKLREKNKKFSVSVL